jgi:hypothetical protein
MEYGGVAPSGCLASLGILLGRSPCNVRLQAVFCIFRLPGQRRIRADTPDRHPPHRSRATAVPPGATLLPDPRAVQCFPPSDRRAVPNDGPRIVGIRRAAVGRTQSQAEAVDPGDRPRRNAHLEAAPVARGTRPGLRPVPETPGAERTPTVLPTDVPEEAAHGGSRNRGPARDVARSSAITFQHNENASSGTASRRGVPHDRVHAPSARRPQTGSQRKPQCRRTSICRCPSLQTLKTRTLGDPLPVQ